MGRRKKTYAEFLRRAREVHGSKYEYPLFSEYTGATMRLAITCAWHGVFVQCVSNHMAGDGCPKCGREIANANIRRVASPKPARERAHKLPPFGALGGLYKLPFWN